MVSKVPSPFLFIHIPKCAGSSVENALIPRITGKGNWRGLSQETQNELAIPGSIDVRQHAKLRWFEENGYDLQMFFKFGVVRNPYDRAISEIDYLRRHSPRGRKVFAGRTWREDLLTLASLKDNINGHDFSACQIDWLKNQHGKIDMDLIIKLEDLEDQWPEVLKTIFRKTHEAYDFRFEKLPRDNTQGRQQPWWEFYDERTRRAVAAKWSRDFEVLGYEK